MVTNSRQLLIDLGNLQLGPILIKLPCNPFASLLFLFQFFLKDIILLEYLLSKIDHHLCSCIKTLRLHHLPSIFFWVTARKEPEWTFLHFLKTSGMVYHISLIGCILHTFLHSGMTHKVGMTGFHPTSLTSFIPSSDKQVCLLVCSFMGVPVLGATILHRGTQVRVVAYKHCHEQGIEVGRVIPMLEIELLGPPHTWGMISFSEAWSSIANVGGLLVANHLLRKVQKRVKVFRIEQTQK